METFYSKIIVFKVDSCIICMCWPKKNSIFRFFLRKGNFSSKQELQVNVMLCWRNRFLCQFGLKRCSLNVSIVCNSHIILLCCLSGLLYCSVYTCIWGPDYDWYLQITATVHNLPMKLYLLKMLTAFLDYLFLIIQLRQLEFHAWVPKSNSGQVN